MPQLKFPYHMSLLSEAHKSWLKLLNEAQELVEADNELQAKAAKGYRLKKRHLPAEVLGRTYSQYCWVINRMYDAYLNSLHLQRAPYMLQIVSLLMKRLYELRDELVHLIVNDYIYVDGGLIQCKVIPQQIEIVVPYHIPLECRDDTIEQVLQRMWADSYQRKNAPPKKMKPISPTQYGLLGSVIEMPTIESSEDAETIEPSVHTIIPEEFIQAIIIQRHERFRQWFMADFRAECIRRRTYFVEKKDHTSLELKIKAATLIQRTYREYMKIKRQRMVDTKRDTLLGLIHDPWKGGLNFDEENRKIYERRREKRTKLQEKFIQEFEREQTRLVIFKKEDQIDDVTDHVREWFKEWYYNYGSFPEFPWELEGGTMMVIRGEYPTVEEKIEEDEMYKTAVKGKTKEKIKQEKEQAKIDAELKAELAKETAKKEAEVLLKARCNPLTDPGYKVQSSKALESVIEALQQYRTSWSIYDHLPPEMSAEVVYGFINHILTEDLMRQIHIDARKYVDELMRLELKLLIKMQQAMFKRLGWKYPKIRPRPKPKPPTVYRPIQADHNLLKRFEELFDLGIISKPTTKIKDIYGDGNYAAYEFNIRDPNATYPPPGYGDTRSRLIHSCVYGIGINPGATRRKAVMLLGPHRNGKSYLVDAVAGELNAVKIDISPEVFSAVVSRPVRKLNLVFLAAKVFQPAVIYMRNVERVFAKKVPPNQKYLKVKKVKGALLKQLKKLQINDKVMFIATCTEPKTAKIKPLVSMFDEVILVPRTDYGSIQMFFTQKLQAIRSIPRDFCVQPLAQLLQGYGFGIIVELFDEILNPERIVKLHIKPLEPTEFLEKLIQQEIEPTTLQDYQEYVDFFINNGYLKKEREEYTIINRSRSEVYKKLAGKINLKEL